MRGGGSEEKAINNSKAAQVKGQYVVERSKIPNYSDRDSPIGKVHYLYTKVLEVLPTAVEGLNTEFKVDFEYSKSDLVDMFLQDGSYLVNLFKNSDSKVGHSCAFKKEDGNYYFFDPNYELRESASKDAIFSYITSRTKKYDSSLNRIIRFSPT